jgi:hypothetical protein
LKTNLVVDLEVHFCFIFGNMKFKDNIDVYNHEFRVADMLNLTGCLCSKGFDFFIIPYPCLPAGRAYGEFLNVVLVFFLQYRIACGENVPTRKRIPRSACPDLREFWYCIKGSSL